MTDAPSTHLSSAAKWTLGIQFALALLISALALSHNSSMQFGRAPTFADVVALGSPVLLVVLAAILARQMARRGQAHRAWPIILSPLPLAFVLAMLAGMV